MRGRYVGVDTLTTLIAAVAPALGTQNSTAMSSFPSSGSDPDRRLLDGAVRLSPRQLISITSLPFRLPPCHLEHDAGCRDRARGMRQPRVARGCPGGSHAHPRELSAIRVESQRLWFLGVFRNVRVRDAKSAVRRSSDRYSSLLSCHGWPDQQSEGKSGFLDLACTGHELIPRRRGITGYLIDNPTRTHLASSVPYRGFGGVPFTADSCDAASHQGAVRPTTAPAVGGSPRVLLRRVALLPRCDRND